MEAKRTQRHGNSARAGRPRLRKPGSRAVSKANRDRGRGSRAARPGDGVSPLKGLLAAKLTVFVLIMIALSDFCLMLINLEGSSFAAKGPGSLTLEAAQNFESRLMLANGLGAALVLACAGVFIVWFYQAHKNLVRAGVPGLKYSSGWAIGGFFVPVLNLVRPYQLMCEVWRGSATWLRGPKGEAWEERRVSPLVGSWWIGNLVTYVAFRVSGVMQEKANSLPELGRAFQANMVAQVCDITAAILAIVLVLRLTDLQKRAAANAVTKQRVRSRREVANRIPPTVALSR